MSQAKMLQPGEARCPGPSTKDIILSDGWKVPDALVAESYRFQGDADIPYERYTSQAFFDLEMEKLWTRVWQWACREEQIPEPGDYVVYDIGYHSIVVVRTEDRAIKAYYNACLHRGTKLAASHSIGSVSQFRCSYHGWTWSLDGELQDIPCRWDFPHVKDEDFKLPEVQVATWGGFVFINMDPEAKPLEEHLGVLPEHFRNWPLDQRYTVLHVQKELPCNWKSAQEAFLEAYHVVETHAQGLPTSGDANAQYDVFGDTVTRFVHTIGYPSPHYDKPISQQEILQLMTMTLDDNTLQVGEGETARSVAAQYMRESFGKEWKVDLSKYSDSEMLDSIEYHLFPNMFLFPGISLPMLYRFRPLGMDVNQSLFDLVFLRPKPDNGDPVPEPPEPYRIGAEDSYSTVPGMSEGLGFVYDQDTMNLKLQQEGFRASRGKRGQTLGNYQEIRMRNIHRMIDAYLQS